jgi:xylan 1,4-beta-xylosidase
MYSLTLYSLFVGKANNKKTRKNIMTVVTNPIIPGMAPDPSIIRVENDYYIATSTFHWMPAIQIFHSTDLANWSLIEQVLKHDEINLQGTNTPAGIWAPNLSYDEKTGRYWLAFSHMLNMAGREFNADSYAMWATDIRGPWSKPIYMTSIGFDPAIFHDENGKHYLSILEWESRVGYQAPGHIVIAEVDLENGGIIGEWHRVTHGFTTRGAAEAPQLYKHGGYYYLLIAAGGTGYAHGVEIGRSKDIFGPYEPHPSGEPIITSSPQHLFSLGDPDAGQFDMYNPNSVMQKAGHGSLVETQTGEWYVAHLMSRPLPNTKLNPLGRETSLQKMIWTDDGWLEMSDGSNLAKMTFEGLSNTLVKTQQKQDFNTDFASNQLDNHFMTPYHLPNKDWVNQTERPNHLRIYGGNSLFSQMSPNLVATRATSLNFEVATELSFNPDHYSENAGLGLYYDSNNWFFVRMYYSESLKTTTLSILQAKLGERIEFIHHKVPMNENSVQLKISYKFGKATVYYQFKDTNEWVKLIENVDVS